MYDPNNGPDRSRMMRDYERDYLIEPAVTEDEDPCDDWEMALITKIYHNTVDDGFYKEGRT